MWKKGENYFFLYLSETETNFVCSLPGCKQIFKLSLTLKQLKNGKVTNKLKEIPITNDEEEEQQQQWWRSLDLRDILYT